MENLLGKVCKCNITGVAGFVICEQKTWIDYDQPHLTQYNLVVGPEKSFWSSSVTQLESAPAKTVRGFRLLKKK